MRRIFGWFMAVMALSLAGPAAAQEQAGNVYWETQMWDARMRIALPSWVDEQALLLPSSQARRNRRDLVAQMEFIPGAQNFDDWQTMLKVRGERVGNTADLAMAQIATVQLRGIEAVCQPGKFQTVPIASHPQVIVTLALCGDYNADTENLGLGAGKGSTFILRMTKSQQAVLTVHQEWRGAAYDPAQRDSWPVSREELATMINRFAGMAIRQIPVPTQDPAAPAQQ